MDTQLKVPRPPLPPAPCLAAGAQRHRGRSPVGVLTPSACVLPFTLAFSQTSATPTHARVRPARVPARRARDETPSLPPHLPPPCHLTPPSCPPALTSARTQDRVKRKLKEWDLYIDEELPDYIS